MEDRFNFRIWYPATDRQDPEMAYKKLEAGEIWIPESEGAPLVIMMCTGLKDKNGKLIYEGDILEYHNKHLKCSHIGFVKWDQNFAEFGGTWPDGCHPAENDKYGAIMALQFKSCKILGNIYENPDFLKK